MIGQAQCLAHIVGDQYRCSRFSPVQHQELLLNVQAGNGIDGTKGLVEQQDLRAQHHGTAQAHALLLASTQLVRVAIQLLPLDLAERQQFIQPLLNVPGGPTFKTSEQADIVAGGQVGEQPGALYRKTHTPANGRQPVVFERLTKGADLAGIRVHQPVT
jgi:hypothetical protein